MSGIRQFIHEVHRRSLWQVLLIYIGGSWVAFEVVQTLTEGLGLPGWFPALALVLLIVLLPVVLATAFVRVAEPAATISDPTLMPVDEAHTEAARKRRLLTWRNAGLSFMAALAVWGIVATGWYMLYGGASDSPAVDSKSVAVLPLENMSPDPENQYFAAGIHDEILSQLANIRDLTVISRTSVMQYAPDQTDKDVRTIAKELGVGSVLEGSVRRAGPRVRITVQLIDGQSDAHLWSESYERELTVANVFDIQTDIAEQIARALRAEFSTEERARIASIPTENPEAYEYYLRARAAFDFDTAVGMLQRAVELDPEFATAWAELARRWIDRSFTLVDPDLRERGVEALDRAVDLAPEAFETYRARETYHQLVTQDLDQALEQVRAAERLRPNDANLLGTKGRVELFAGQWDKGLATLERAAALDPLNSAVARGLAEVHRRLGNFTEAERYYDRAIALDASNPAAYNGKFSFLVVALGDTVRAREFAEQHPNRSEQWLAELAYLRRDYENALEFFVSKPLLEGNNFARVQRIYRAMNELARVRAIADSVAPWLEARLNWAIEAQAGPTTIAYSHSLLGGQYANLGDREAAIRQAELAIETYSVSADALNYWLILSNVAGIYRSVGDYDRAIDYLEEMLSVPTEYTAAYMRIHPAYDPLRDHPRFQALLAKYE